MIRQGILRASLLLMLLGLFGEAVTALASETAVDLEVFVRAGCPHCEAAKTFLHELQRRRPELRILIQDIGQDQAARARLGMLARRYAVTPIGVPAFYLQGELIIGYQDAQTTGARLLALLDANPAAFDAEPFAACHPAQSDCNAAAVQVAAEEDSVVLPWFGRVSFREVGLPLFTLAIGLLDGFNPCAMWVLLFLLSLLVTLRDRVKMSLVAGTFVLVSGLLYFAFMAAWLNVFLLIGLSRAVQLTLGGVATIIGAVNVKDFFALRQGPSLSIPDAAKPGLYAQLRRIVQAENLTGALIGIVVLAGLVNVVELLCTAGFPALYTHILTAQSLSTWQYYGYLALYNLAYVFDDALMVTIAVVSLGRHKLEEREGRWLKLVSGAVMIGLGVLLIMKPDLMAR
ncbi:MAG: NrdH-redoxin [Nitrospira sp.]